MSALRCDLFQSDNALERALTIDAAHITRGARGPHVQKIQTALTLILDDPPCKIAETELNSGEYGAATAAAVLRFKTKNKIINYAYQSKPDEITGKMTTRALDDTMVDIEAQFAADVLGLLTHLDDLLLGQGLLLPPLLQLRFSNIRRSAWSLMAPGGPRVPGIGRFGRDYNAGLELMNVMSYGKPHPFVSGAVSCSVRQCTSPMIGVVQVIVGGGIVIFLIAIGTVIGIILVATILHEAGKLGEQINRALNEALDAGEAAILDNVVLLDKLDAAVEQCKRISQNPSPQCLAALAKYASKVADVIAIRNQLQSTLKDLRDALKNPLKKLVWKILAKRAEADGKALANADRELLDIVREIINECGCRFIHI